MDALRLPNDFRLERYFSKYEFTVKYTLCCSDTEALTMDELLNMADDECKMLWKTLKLSYTETTGHPLLKKEIAKLYAVESSQVLTLVPAEGIYIGLKCLLVHLVKLNGGQPIHAVCMSPNYQSLFENLAYLGCPVNKWEAQYTDDGWKFDISQFKAALKQNTKLLVVNFPHNPTGYVPTPGEWQELIDFCRQKDIYVFSDEMYRFTNNDGAEVLQSACSMYENSISLSGLSKAFAMPGVRTGWVCTKNPELMQMIASYKDYTTICASAPTEILSIIATRNAEHILHNHTLKIIKKNLEVLQGFFARHKDIFEWHAPKACTMGLLRLKGWLLQVGSGGATGFCHVLVEEFGVLLVPAALFDFKDEYVRLGFCRRNLPEALEQLEEFIKKYGH